MRDARRDLPPITFLEAPGSRRPFWSGTPGVLILGVVGAGLLALATIWVLQPASHPVLGLAPRIPGLAAGLVGIVCLSIAAYHILDRLGLPRDRLSS
jgi:hypothetical protein